ncbi:unnamed protein product [Macrosiphum euphorbiae]|uniref:Uncharacterized protein n=1 Tax=Macrosiphum euphorbiae TaxID=13131 RepID=A0AAV0WWR4_9HEMI|nr:unnamed protein product [Macrosiphum euphorbiae]
MVGRKCSVPPSVLVDAILSFKDNVVSRDEKGDMKIAVATNPIWAEISAHLDNNISKSAIHTLVFKKPI